MEAIDQMLANDVHLLFLHSAANDRRNGTPLERWIDSSLARCERLGCGTAVELPLNPINRVRFEVLTRTCLQPVRLMTSACRQLLDRGSGSASTMSLGVRAAHRLLTTGMFGTANAAEPRGILRQYSLRLAPAPAVTRAQLWQRAALMSDENRDDFAHFRDLLAGALGEAGAPSAVVGQARGAMEVEELGMSLATQALKRRAAQADSQGLNIVVPPGSTAERVLAARGLTIDQIRMLEQTIAMFDAMSFRWIRWMFTDAGAVGARRPADARGAERGADEGTLTDTNSVIVRQMIYPVAAKLTRLSAELMNVALLRAMSRDAAIELLEFQTALFMRYILVRCGREAACVTGLSEIVRSSKGMLAIAYGTALPASRTMLMELTPEEEEEGVRVTRQILRRLSSGGKIDSATVAPFGTFYQGVMRKQGSRKDANLHLEGTALTDRDAFIDIFRASPLEKGQRRSVFAIISVGSKQLGFVELGTEAELSAQVDRWRQAASTRDSAVWAQATASAAAAIWGRLKSQIPATVTRILVAPDSRLLHANLPLLAAAAGITQDVGVVPSFAHLVSRQRSDATPNKARGFLLTGLQFGSGQRFAPITFRPSVAQVLAGARTPVDSAWGGSAEWASVSRDLQKSTIGILVTHGGVPIGDDDALSAYVTRSTIALSNANVDSAARVNAAQFAQLDLRRTPLMMLIACRLGDGEILDGQGVLGFPLALTAAGAQASVVSLWPADNGAATELFVEAFVEAAVSRRLHFQQALREAQEAVKAQYPAPTSWAGWTVVGNPFGRLP